MSRRENNRDFILLLAMNGLKKEVTTLFADLSGSTGIYEKLGDERGRDLVFRCVDRLRQISERHEGTFIKSNGDDVMCTFPSPQDASDAACSMQVFIEEFSSKKSPVPVSVRIGFQHGTVRHEDDGDVRGDSVNVASRLADYAKARQIVTTEETISQISDAKPFRRLERVRLKGKTERVGICEIIWTQDYSMTVMSSIDRVG